MDQNTFMKFQADVQGMANHMMTQAMCAEKGIDYNQLMQAAQMAHLQGILQQEEQRRIMQTIANHYGTQNTTGLFGKIKQAVSGANQAPSMPINNPFMQAMMQQAVAPTTVTPVTPTIPVPQGTDERVAKLEEEVSGIKNDVSEIKNLLGNLASSIASSNDIPLK